MNFCYGAIMRISDIGGPKGPGSSKKPRKTEASGDFSSLIDSGDSGNVDSTQASAPAVQLGGLLAINDVPPVTSQGDIQARVRHGRTLLDDLEQLRIEMLDGNIAPETAKQLVETVREEQEETHDAALESILQDIELRAEVEIAKLEKAGAL